MSPSDTGTLHSADIVDLITDVKPSEEVLAWLSSVISDPVKVEAVGVLARRFEAHRARGTTPRFVNCASSVAIDRDRFKRAMWRRRIPMKEIGPMINRCDSLAYVWCTKGRINFYTLDELATALSENVESLIAEICAPEEMERLAL